METINLNEQVIWEENDLIDQLKKFENRPIFDPSNGISETKSASVEDVCKDTGSKKKWTRICQKCNKIQLFKNEKQLKLSISRNRNCISCIHKQNHIGDKIGKLTIVNQYYSKNKHQFELKVDYICECGNKTLNKSYQKVKNQMMCKKCKNTNFYKINLETSFNSLFNDYIKNAIRRKLLFTLTKEEFKSLTKENCYYCGSSPSNIKRPGSSSGEYIYNGIDRKNNKDGYTLNNCVSCCKTCNFAKHILDINDFLNHIRKIYDFKIKDKFYG